VCQTDGSPLSLVCACVCVGGCVGVLVCVGVCVCVVGVCVCCVCAKLPTCMNVTNIVMPPKIHP